MHSLREDSAKANQFEHARIDSPNNTLNFILLWHMDHANYWHFTFDIAFRLFYFITHFPLLIPRLRLVVVGTNSLSPFQHDLLAAILGSKPKLIFSPVSAIVESALFIPPVQTLLTRKDWLVSYSRVLSSRLTTNLNAGLDNGAVHNSGSSQRQMLYIQRGITKNPRVLLNEQEVIRILKKSGFSICDPGRLTIHDQARLFHSADLVVGPHGSAFTNILYMKPRSCVIEFTNSTYDPFHDFFLARQLDISFTRIRQNDSIANTLCHQPFRVDILKVERAVTLDQVSLHK
jgi:capsular polysaccharide biosynthesis protein